jgi:hypothetical protein
MYRGVMRFIIIHFILIFYIAYGRCDQPLQLFHRVNQINIEEIDIDVQALQQVAQSTLSFIKQYQNEDWFYPLKKSFLEKSGVTFDGVKKTLLFIVNVIEEDKGKNNQRMLNPDFLRNHFTFVRWLPDFKSAEKRGVSLDKDKLRITKYLIYQVPGSYRKTKKFPHALYSAQDRDLIKKITKQDALSGKLDKEEKAKPLVWLSRNSLEEALMQGTIYVTMPDNKTRVFNVEYNNGIAYDHSIKDKWHQKRYWSFKEIEKILDGVPTIAAKKQTMPGVTFAGKIMPGVSFAGDIYSLGIGKTIALHYQNQQTGKNTLHLGLLVDTGGAFENNLYQLDFFAGIFPSRKIFNEKTKNIPTMAEAYILIKKGIKKRGGIKGKCFR